MWKDQPRAPPKARLPAYVGKGSGKSAECPRSPTPALGVDHPGVHRMSEASQKRGLPGGPSPHPGRPVGSIVFLNDHKIAQK